MSGQKPSICLVLAVTSETALFKVLNAPSLLHAYSALTDFLPENPIHVISNVSIGLKVQSVLGDRLPAGNLLTSELGQPQSFATTIGPLLPNYQAVLIHDASRPFVDHPQFARVLDAFDDDVDAARPVMPFTETLKILTRDSVIQETLDRSTVLRISTPEIIRVSAIDTTEPDCGWFLPLKKDARIVHVEGNPRGLRINSEDDARLMEMQLD